MNRKYIKKSNEKGTLGAKLSFTVISIFYNYLRIQYSRIIFIEDPTEITA